MCLLGMASLAGRKQEQRPKLMPVSAAAAVPAEAERAAVALSWSAALRNCQILRLKMSKLSHVRPPRNVPEHCAVCCKSSAAQRVGTMAG